MKKTLGFKKHLKTLTLLCLSLASTYSVFAQNTDPYTTIQAIDYDGQSGTQTAINNTVVGFISNNDYIFFEDVDFDAGPLSGVVSAASNGSGGQIEFRLGGVNGTLIATAEITRTGELVKFSGF